MQLDPQITVAGTSASVGDFWQWAYSSLAENATRGVFAEYLVGLALGVTDEPRVEWDAADLRYRGQLIEVKSTADNQTWEQSKPSTLQFDIAKKQSWNASDNTTATHPERPAAVYVFCHYSGAATSDAVVDTDRWHFYVVSTATLDRELGDQKSARISTIRRLTQAIAYSSLRAAIDEVLSAS